MVQQIASGVFDTHPKAEIAVRALVDAGVSVNHISIITKNLETTEQVHGFVTTGDGAAVGASSGAWWGGLFGLLLGVAVLWIPGVGPIFAAGPITVSVLGMLEGAAVGATSGGLVGALIGAGFSQDKALKLETVVMAGDFVVMVHGSGSEMGLTRNLLELQGARDVEIQDAVDAGVGKTNLTTPSGEQTHTSPV